VYNRTPSKARAFAEEFKVKVYGNPAELARDVDVVLSIVSDDDAVKAVMLGDGGVLNGVKGGSLVIEMSTISPSIELAKLMTPSRPSGTGFHCWGLGRYSLCGVNGFVSGWW
ncbi:MAG: NAD(P)-binding domain-containing protein, partial [Caldivirga sp.]